MVYYVVHPGWVTYKDQYGMPVSEPQYIDAGTLAALYGLQPGEYEIGNDEQEPDPGDIIHIHLRPRPDGRYKKVLPLEADHYDKPVGWRKKEQERRKYV